MLVSAGLVLLALAAVIALAAGFALLKALLWLVLLPLRLLLWIVMLPLLLFRWRRA